MRCQVRSPATMSLWDAGVQAETVGRREEAAADTTGTGCGSSGHHMVSVEVLMIHLLGS